MAITVGLDFGTHQTKICYETVERGTVFHEVLQFRSSHGEMSLTLPSVVRLCADGRLRYGQDAVDAAGGRVMTYFKQIMFSWSAELETRTSLSGVCRPGSGSSFRNVALHCAYGHADGCRPFALCLLQMSGRQGSCRCDEIGA